MWRWTRLLPMSCFRLCSGWNQPSEQDSGRGADPPLIHRAAHTLVKDTLSMDRLDPKLRTKPLSIGGWKEIRKIKYCRDSSSFYLEEWMQKGKWEWLFQAHGIDGRGGTEWGRELVSPLECPGWRGAPQTGSRCVSQDRRLPGTARAPVLAGLQTNPSLLPSTTLQ